MDNKSLHYQWTKYIEEVKKLKEYLIITCLVFVLIFFFQKPLLKLLSLSIVDPVLSQFHNGKLTEIFLGLIFFATIFYASYNLYNKRVPSPKSLVNLFFVAIVYFIIFRNRYYFQFLSFSFYKHLFYADSIVCSCCLYLLRFKNYSYINRPEDQDGFVEDNLYQFNQKDFLTRKPFAKEIAYHISNTLNNKAFAISVIGNWGSGKTVFLEFLEEELNKHENNEIVRFNPWKATDSKLMIDDFFATLANKIKKYDKNGAEEIRAYGKYLAGLNESTVNKILEKALENNLSVSEKYEEIENSIILTGKRFIVFIDDSDRLTGKELIQVLKIVRNTANFTNLIFIAALDPNYAISALKNTKELASEAEYLEKIFQLEIVLPPISKLQLYHKLLDLLEVENMADDEKQEFVNAFRYISNTDQADFFFFGKTMYSGMFEHFFSNLRDVIRFVNSFKIRYRILKGEVDLYDLFVLEILKLKSIGIYSLLTQKKLLDFKKDTTPDQYCLNEEVFNNLYEDENNPLNLDKNTKADIRRLLDNLLSYSEKYKTKRSIIYPLNFSIYVNYQLFNNVSLKEFTIMREKSDDEFFHWVENEFSQGKKESINSILGSIYQFNSENQFKKYTLLFLRLCPYDNIYLTHVLGILKGSDVVINQYFDGNASAATNFIKSLFEDDRISDVVKIEIASVFARENFEYQKVYYFEQQIWQEIVLNSFKKFKKDNQAIMSIDFKLYLRNWSGLGPERKIIIYEPANVFFRQCIEKDKIGYLKHALRSYYSPPGEVFIFDPFIDYIFGSQASFEVFLSNIESQDRFIQLVRKYYQVYKDNSFREFVMKDESDRKFILDEIGKLQ